MNGEPLGLSGAFCAFPRIRKLLVVVVVVAVSLFVISCLTNVNEDLQSESLSEPAETAEAQDNKGVLTFATPTPTPVDRFLEVKADLERLLGEHYYMGMQTRGARFYEAVEQCGGAGGLVDGLVQGIIPEEFLYREGEEKPWSYAIAGEDRRGVRLRLGPIGYDPYGDSKMDLRWELHVATSGHLTPRKTLVAKGTILQGCEVHTTSVEPIWE